LVASKAFGVDLSLVARSPPRRSRHQLLRHLGSVSSLTRISPPSLVFCPELTQTNSPFTGLSSPTTTTHALFSSLTHIHLFFPTTIPLEKMAPSEGEFPLSPPASNPGPFKCSPLCPYLPCVLLCARSTRLPHPSNVCAFHRDYSGVASTARVWLVRVVWPSGRGGGEVLALVWHCWKKTSRGREGEAEAQGAYPAAY
jgi:hypothetical protein